MGLFVLLLLVAAACGAVCNVSETVFYSECDWPGDWTLDGRVVLYNGAAIRVAGNMTVASGGELQMIAGGASLSVFGSLVINGEGRFVWLTRSDEQGLEFLLSWSDHRPAIGTSRRPQGVFRSAGLQYLGFSPDACIQLSVFQSSMVDGYYGFLRMDNSNCPRSNSGLGVLIGGAVVFVALILAIFALIKRCNRRRQEELQQEALMVENDAFSDFNDEH
jgi:hypothetical protein